MMFTPPLGPPPPGARPALQTTSSCPYNIDLELLAKRGWVSLPLEQTAEDPLYAAFSHLFSSSAQFFNLPEEERLKYKCSQPSAQASEEGYSRVQGEKCMITLRHAARTPTEFEMKSRAAEAWKAGGDVMREVMGCVEESLGMEGGVLQKAMGDKVELPAEGESIVATLLRMFRYDRPVPELSGDGEQPPSKVVAEPHKDLGLLSLVVGHTPGLECWDTKANTWVSCEENKDGKMSATLLAGQTLAMFTNGRYSAGKHRVFVHPLAKSLPDSTPDKAGATAETFIDPDALPLLTSPAYRFSLVFTLRAHLPVRVSSSKFETAITGAFPTTAQFTDLPCEKIYKAISEAHWNVNISVEERRRQEQQIKMRSQQAQKASNNEKSEMNSSRKRLSFAGLKNIFKRTQTVN
ncbi:hypothetical protein BD410DRAFT_788544 [Rickenella mellea]|uniref:Isopenicillin N synthase-like Fe(2+) 2OG dioxygenase domain-containing protein n=1 Tax=Rickenella mellea TaxID=50990 RepID=A0A4Y7Q4S7_9AGAM|nr:hypothetical protein BD410DRAFT_788544 [Rickenella mellea]